MGLLAIALAVVAGALAGCAQDPPLDVAPSVDLSRLQGQWYEIAKLPRPTQADCVATTAYWTRDGDGLDIVDDCRLHSFDGPHKTISMSARPLGEAPAKLGLDIGGFYGDFWILDVGPEYEWVAIGHPSRAYLWILARTAKPDAAVVAGVVKKMQDKQFDVARLEYTPQE